MLTEHDGIRLDADLLVRVAESYYIENMTQTQIAGRLGISSSTVSRLLNRARDEGIVRISIVRPQGRNTFLEQTLRQQFALDQVIVASVPAGVSDDDAIRRVISTVAAPSIDALIKPGMLVGIGRGRTLTALAEALQPFATPRHITLIQVLGEFDSQQSPARSAELTRQLAEMYAGTSYFLNAPALVEDPILVDLLLRTSGVRQVLPFYDRLDMMLVGIAPLPGSPLDIHGLLNPDQVGMLEAAGAIGDLCCHFFTADGRVVDDVYPGRAVGISWEQLQRCPCVIALAVGDSKVAAVRALIEARMIHVLVTDERTALQIVHTQEV